MAEAECTVPKMVRALSEILLILIHSADQPHVSLQGDDEIRGNRTECIDSNLGTPYFVRRLLHFFESKEKEAIPSSDPTRAARQNAC